jgi:hypothetical protein
MNSGRDKSSELVTVFQMLCARILSTGKERKIDRAAIVTENRDKLTQRLDAKMAKMSTRTVIAAVLITARLPTCLHPPVGQEGAEWL